MKKKNLLMFLLAVNALGVSQSTAAGTGISGKYKKLYDGMIQNIEDKKSNAKNYEMLEKVLEKRNKELKDLYNQGDYVVKPEYLEWQIFFSGFYSHKESGDNTLSNGTYHSDPANVNGKFYTRPGEAKHIDMGLYIPERTIKRSPVELKLVNPPEITLNSLEVNPEVSPSVAPGTNSGKYEEYTPTGSMKVFLETYENLFKSASNTTYIKTDGVQELIGSESEESSYKIEYNINTNLDITIDNTIDSFNKVFVNGVSTVGSEWATGDHTITTTYTPSTGGTAFYSGGTRVVGVFGGTGNNIANQKEMDLKGPFSYGMVAEGGSNTLINNQGAVISDNKENDEVDSWYNNVIPHIGETIRYEVRNTIDDTLISYKDGILKHPNGNKIIINGREVYRHNGTSELSTSTIIDSSGDYKLITKITSYKGGYLGYKVGMFVNDNSAPSNTTIQNDGTIKFNGYSSIGMYTSAGSAGLSGIRMINNGTIEIKTGNYTGYSNFGMKLDGTVNNQTDKIIVNNREININSGAGIAVVNGSVGEGFVENSNTGKITVSNGTGIYLAPISGSARTEDAVNNGTITVTNGAGMYALGGRTAAVTRVINNGEISVSGGMGMVAEGKNSEAVNNSSNFKIGNSTGGFYANEGGKTINNADLAISSSGVSLFNINTNSTGDNTGDIKINGSSSVAFYNKGSLTSKGNIEINGNNSIAVYSDGTDNTDIKADEITLKGEKGAVFYTNGGKINITPNSGKETTVTASGKSSYLFYDSSFSTGNLPAKTFVINGDLDAYVKDGAVAFDFKNYSGSLIDYVENKLLDIQSGTTTIDIEGTAFHANNSTISIDEISEINGAGLASASGSVKIKGSDVFFAERSIINIDKDSYLDVAGDTYAKNQSNIANSSVSLFAGKTITGSQNEQYGIGQENLYNTNVILENEGKIELSGSKTTGIYGKNTKILNKGGIISGDDSTGIFSSNSSETINTGNINFGNSGIGIYGVNTYGTGISSYNKINITMSSGTLTADGTTEAYGIFADNKLGPGNSSVNFDGGLIDLSGIKADVIDKAVAVAVKDTDLNSAGDINTAEKGIAFYINGGNSNITGGTINLDKDKSIGFALKNVETGKFNGTGSTINIAGNDIILFHLKDSLGIKDDFLVNVAAGSNYRYADMKNSSFTFDKSFNIEDNINFIVADTSAVLLGTNSDINSTGTGNIGVYTKTNAEASVLNSLSVSDNVTNNGKIRLGNSSAGIYVDDKASALNNTDGIITVGDNSQGIYAKNSGSVVNKGKIDIGVSSIGIYYNNASVAENSGDITSSSDNAVGVYMNNQAVFTNNNLISLSGQGNIGIYDTGTGNRTIDNEGVIVVGNSLSADSPNVGIYSTDGSLTINHKTNAVISSGINSMGIYAKNTDINIDGIMNIGDNGTGIYADSGSKVFIGNDAELNLGALNAAGVYALGGSAVDNYTSNIIYPSDSYAFVLNSNAVLNNHALNIELDNEKVFAYSDNAVINNNGNFTLTGVDNIVLYAVNNSGVTNSGVINAAGTQGSNIGIYSKNSNIINNGDILMGDSVIVDEYNPFVNKYSVAIYGENSSILNDSHGKISIGQNSAGLYGVGGSIVNRGTITSVKDGAIGVFIDNGTAENSGVIDLYGADSVGLAGKNESLLTNTHSGVIRIHGANSTGIFANLNSSVINEGTIEVLGNNSIGIHLQGKSKLLNEGKIILGSNLSESFKVSYATGYDIPEIQNAGIIKVSEKFEVPGNLQISIKPAPSSFREPTASEIFSENYALEDIDGRYLISNAVSFVAPYFAATEPIVVLPDFSQHTNSIAYKLEDVFIPTTPDGGPNSGKVRVKSKSITWDVIPSENADGNIDLWMVKIPYDVYTNGLWYDGFGKSLDVNYAGADAEGTKIFDKVDYIDNEKDLRHIMASLGGSVYSNINQREEDIERTFENSLNLLQNSQNNTKENVKINVIAGKGNRKDKTDGVEDYDSSYTGIVVLREVERTYRHTFGYSAGYLHSGFEFKDGNESEEWVDTLQLGVHSKYKADGWELRNNITGRASIHNIDRNIDWPSPNSRSEMNGTYETYSISSDNRLGKELGIGKNTSVTPYGGIKAMYVVRPTFEEEGLERLKVEGNDAWSVKPRVGVELKTSVPVSKNSAWNIKGTLDLAYEYELANLNKRERAQLVAAEDEYHDLAKSEEEKGQFRTRAEIGVEVENKYGIFLTGEYITGENNQEDYRAGVSLKAVF